MIRAKQLVEPEYYATADLVRADPTSFYTRLLQAIPDWTTLARPLEVAFCPDRGRPTDPVVYYKIFLIAYLENISYDTELAARIHDSLAIRQFLQYNLTETTPDHSTIGEVRGHLAAAQVDLLPALFEPVLTLCAAVQLLGGTLTAVDSTLLPANASLGSLRSLTTGQRVQDYLRGLPSEHPLPPDHPPLPPVGKRKVSNQDFRSQTDPDARILQQKAHPRDMYYRCTHLTDRTSHLILAAEVATADTGEVTAACPVVLEGSAQLALQGLRLGTVLADTGFDDADFHAFVEELHALPLTFYKEDSTVKVEAFKKAHFLYDSTTDSYRCPHGQVLPYICQDDTRRRARYASDAIRCAACPDHDDCLAADAKQRWLSRAENEASRERNTARCHTDAGRASLRQRKSIVECPFGHMKTYGGMGLVNCRGLGKVRLKAAFAALAWNLIQLVNHVCPLPKRTKPGTQGPWWVALRTLGQRVGVAIQACCLPYHRSNHRMMTVL